MTAFSIESTGRIDTRDSAFPQAIQLPDGEVLCSFSVGGGQYVHGGTEFARSHDGGRTWSPPEQILPATIDPPTASALKLSRSADGQTIFAYGTRYLADQIDRFGDRPGESVYCMSRDGGRTWTKPFVVPMPDCPIEVSHSLCCLASGRLLAPGAILADKQRLGEEVFVVISDDGGKTWPMRRTVFKDPSGGLGYWEQKLIELAPRKILAIGWTVTLGDYRDQCNSFSLSCDDGMTWSVPRSTGIRGQTMSALVLDPQHLLVLYNRRYGRQGVVMARVRISDTSWTVLEDDLLYDAQAFRDGPESGSTGVDELASFQFGFPTAIRLQDGAILATHWCVEDGVCGIRWTRLLEVV